MGEGDEILLADQNIYPCLTVLVWYLPCNNGLEEVALVIVAAHEDGGGEVEGQGPLAHQARDVLRHSAHNLQTRSLSQNHNKHWWLQTTHK